MNFLSRMLQNWLFGENPTENWAVDPRLVPAVDLDRLSLNNVKVNESAAALAGLGPAECFEFNDWFNVSYPSRGLQLRLRNGLLDEFQVVWDGETASVARLENFVPYSGAILAHGMPAPINGQLDVDNWLRIYPNPDDDSAADVHDNPADQGGLERMLEYYFERKAFGWEVLFNSQGKLAAISVAYYGEHGE
ncbi:MAG: hypothetical protein K1X74_00145 [Pirellulales bacterium]|nr:hypothetical protein [Pirellulales bacterium]